MINEEIQELVLTNSIQIDYRAVAMAELLFEDKIDNHNLIKNAAYWITIGLLMTNTSRRLPDASMDGDTDNIESINQ